MPVFPPVASTNVMPGLNLPDRSASSIRATPKRSLTLPPGFRISSLATILPGNPRAIRESSTNGVPPIVAETFEKITAGPAFVLSARSKPPSPVWNPLSRYDTLDDRSVRHGQPRSRPWVAARKFRSATSCLAASRSRRLGVHPKAKPVPKPKRRRTRLRCTKSPDRTTDVFPFASERNLAPCKTAARPVRKLRGKPNTRPAMQPANSAASRQCSKPAARPTVRAVERQACRQRSRAAIRQAIRLTKQQRSKQRSQPSDMLHKLQLAIPAGKLRSLLTTQQAGKLHFSLVNLQAVGVASDS